MKLNELVNTFKSMFYIFTTATLAMKTNDADISKYKILLKRISKYTITMLVSSFSMLYNGLKNDALTNSQTKEDVIINTILSIIISIPIATTITLLYIIMIGILWLIYFIWHRKTKKPKKDKDEIIDV